MSVLRNMHLDDMRQNLPPEFSADEARQWLGTWYRAPLKALVSLEQTGDLVRLKRGVYGFRRGFEPLAAAASIHGSSYVSFETALAYHGMIPERTPTIMSVVDGRPATFDTPMGRFEYYSQARPLFALGMDLVFLNDRSCPMANREKALLDTLARAKLRAHTLEPQQVLAFVLDALRVDKAAMEKLSVRKLCRLAALYRNWAPRHLAKALRDKALRDKALRDKTTERQDSVEA